MEEYKIGEVFQFGKKKLKCIYNNGKGVCKGCMFNNLALNMCNELALFIGGCASYERSDNKNVIFIEVKEEKTTES